MSYFPETYARSKRKIKVEVDLRKKSDLKKGSRS